MVLLYDFISIYCFFIAILFSGTAHTSMAIRYWFLVKDDNPHYSFLDSLRVHYLTPILARITPGNLGEGIKVIHRELKLENALFYHSVERMTDFIVIFISSIFLLFIFFDKIVVRIIFIALIFVVIILFLIYRSDRLIERINTKLPNSIRIKDKWFINNIKNIKKNKLTIFFTLSFVVWVITTMVYYTINYMIGLELSYFKLIPIISTVIIIYSISGVPGGLGVREITLTYFLVKIGVSSYLSVIYPIVLTIYFFTVETLFAVLSQLIYFIIHKKTIH